MPNGPSAQQWKQQFSQRPEVYTAFALNIRLLHMVPNLLDPNQTDSYHSTGYAVHTGTLTEADHQPSEQRYTQLELHEQRKGLIYGARPNDTSNGPSNGTGRIIKTEPVEDDDGGTPLPEPATVMKQEGDKVQDQAPVIMLTAAKKGDPIDPGHGTSQSPVQVHAALPVRTCSEPRAKARPRDLGLLAPANKGQILPIPLPHHHRIQPNVLKHNDQHSLTRVQYAHPPSHLPKRTSTCSPTKANNQRSQLSNQASPQKGSQQGNTSYLSPKTLSKRMLIRSPNPAPMPLPSPSKDEPFPRHGRTCTTNSDQQALVAAFQRSVRSLRSEYGLGKKHVAYWLGPRMSVDDARCQIERLFALMIDAHRHSHRRLGRQVLLRILADVHGDPHLFQRKVRSTLVGRSFAEKGNNKRSSSSSSPLKLSKASISVDAPRA